MHARPFRATRWLVLLPLALLLSSCGGTSIVAVTTNDADQLVPALNGTLVVWEDYRSGDADVYARDMTSTPGPETLIAGGPGDQVQPAVSDQYIVWVDNDTAIRARPRGGGNVINVATGSGDRFDPVVCGSLVVWTDMRNGNPDIFGRDLAGGQEFPIAATPATEAYPACDGSRVVYMSTGATTGADISMFDRTTGATTVVSAQPWSEWQPAISGNRVVWQGWPSSAGLDIFGTDLSTGAPFTVTTGPGDQTVPDISGTIVTWQDSRSGTDDVWFVNLGGTESPVGPPGERRAPKVSGRRIVWQQRTSSTASWDIYQRDV
jgi:beta propeller repeat protein